MLKQQALLLYLITTVAATERETGMDDREGRPLALPYRLAWVSVHAV